MGFAALQPIILIQHVSSRSGSMTWVFLPR
jgi:hypothetical protein